MHLYKFLVFIQHQWAWVSVLTCILTDNVWWYIFRILDADLYVRGGLIEAFS